MSISPSVTNNTQAFNRRETDIAYRFLKAWAGYFARAYHPTKVLQPCVLPPTGPAILVCNHTSSIDPILLQAFCPRLVRWMMAKEYFQYKPLRWIFKTVGVILVERTGRDMAATREAIRALESGYVLGVFPEGKIETSLDMLPFQSGIGLLALKTRAPVYPAYLDGAQRKLEMLQAFLTPGPASVAYGPPLDLSDLYDSKNAIDQAATRIQSAVESLKNQFHPGSKI